MGESVLLAYLIHRIKMCYCCQKLEIWKIWVQIGLWLAQRDHMIGSRSPPTHVTSLSQSEAQKVRVDLPPIRSWSIHVISLSQSDWSDVR